MANINDLDNPSVYATYEAPQRIIYVTYQGTLNGEQIRLFYKWLTTEMESTLPQVRGMIFDFRDVDEITSANTRTTAQSSQSIHRNLDLRHIGVALIVRDHYQEQILRITADMTPYPHTKRIVLSMGDAYEYIQQWSASTSSNNQLA